MGIRGVPPGITDPNLRGFLQDIRNALAGVSEKVTKLSTTTTTSSGGGGGSGPGNGGGGNPPPDGGGGLPPGTQSSVVLSISPVKPLSDTDFTLTATVTGTFPTGTATFTRGGETMGGEVTLVKGAATYTTSLPKGTYTFVALYSGDANNYSAISNSLTVEIGSIWDGPPAPPSGLTATGDVFQNQLNWVNPIIGDLQYTEVWGTKSKTGLNTVTDIATVAVKIASTNGSAWNHTSTNGVPIGSGETWYYWVRNRDTENLVSTWEPPNISGVSATTSLDPGKYLTLLTGSITESQLYADLGNAIGAMRGQWTIKIDDQGHIAGIGLATESVNGQPRSSFGVRADQFWIAPPSYPTWSGGTTYTKWQIASGGTRLVNSDSSGNGITAPILYRSKADANLNHAVTDTTWWEPLDQLVPFAVLSTPTTINGQVIPAGVYMNVANIMDATITTAKIRDGAITNLKIGDAIYSNNWPVTSGVPNDSPTNFPFNGWKIDKNGSLKIYGGNFALYGSSGNLIVGAGGVESSQIKRLLILPSSEVFSLGKAPSNTITPSSITLSVYLQGISGSPTWTVTSGTYSGSLPDGVTQTISPSSMGTSVVVFTASLTISGTVYSDTQTIAKLQEGSDALTLLLSNEAHTVPADSSGNVTSYAGASTVAQVFRGATDVSSSEGWSFSAPSYSGCNAPLVSGQTISLDASHAITADIATITIQAAKSGSATLIKIFSVSKTKQGSQGIQGPQGQQGAQGTQGIQGATGSTGGIGPTGVRGSVAASIAVPSATWYDNYAATAVVNLLTNAGRSDTSLVAGDSVTEYYGSSWAQTRYYAGPSYGWTQWTVYINGNLLVSGSVTADALAVNQVWAKQIKLANSTNNWIQSEYFNAGTAGFRIDGSGNAEFYNVKVRGDVLLGGGNLVASSIGNQFVYGSSEYFLQSGYGADLSSYYYPSGYGSFRIHQALYTAPGNQYLKFNRPGGGQFPVAPGQWYQLSAYSGVTNCQVTAFIDWYDASGTSIIYGNYGTTNSTYPGGYIFDDTTYKKISVTAQAPSNCKYATVGFHKPQNDYYLEGYADITQVYFAPVPANYTAVIPWSPGGISLMDTLSLKTNSATSVDYAEQPYLVTLYNSSSRSSLNTSVTLPTTRIRGPVLLQGYAEFEVGSSDPMKASLSISMSTDGYNYTLVGTELLTKIPASTNETTTWAFNIPRYIDLTPYSSSTSVTFRLEGRISAAAASRQVTNGFLSVTELRR